MASKKTIGKIGGTSAKYLAARIKRDRPDIAEATMRGEFSSMRAAAKAAGIPVRRYIHIDADDPKQMVRCIENNCTLEVIEEMLNLFGCGDGETAWLPDAESAQEAGPDNIRHGSSGPTEG